MLKNAVLFVWIVCPVYKNFKTLKMENYLTMERSVEIK